MSISASQIFFDENICTDRNLACLAALCVAMVVAEDSVVAPEAPSDERQPSMFKVCWNMHSQVFVIQIGFI